MENQRLLINTIYSACEGEGVHIGRLQIFIRFQGCAIGCVNCDSKETWSFLEGKSLTLAEVLEQVSCLSRQPLGVIKRISITGGDPLHPKHEKAVIELVRTLKKERFFINLEAAGTRIVADLFDELDFISFDYKTPSSGVVTRVEGIYEMVRRYLGKFQLKSVVEDKRDFDYVLSAYHLLQQQYPDSHTLLDWCLTPAYTPGKLFTVESVRDLFKWNTEAGGPFRVIGQQHKWFYGPDEKNV